MKRILAGRITALVPGVALICAMSLALFSASWAQAAHSSSAPGAAAQNTMGMGPVHVGPHKTFWGYYDSHLDTYYSTDVSDKTQAKMMGINFAPGLKHVPEGAAPPIYLVEGNAAAHQLAVFGSQPGETDYSPLWHEVIVKWKSGSKVVLLTSDNQINALKAKGKLTETDMAHTILDCPIIHVAK
jgi:hypothetical protein